VTFSNIGHQSLIVTHSQFHDGYAMGLGHLPAPDGKRHLATDTIRVPQRAINVRTGAVYTIKHEPTAAHQEQRYRLDATGEQSLIHRYINANNQHMFDLVNAHSEQRDKVFKNARTGMYAITGVSAASLLVLAAILASAHPSTSRTTVVMMPPPRPPHRQLNNNNNNNN
jgi:hypothetical protein